MTSPFSILTIASESGTRYRLVGPGMNGKAYESDQRERIEDILRVLDWGYRVGVEAKGAEVLKETT